MCQPNKNTTESQVFASFDGSNRAYYLSTYRPFLLNQIPTKGAFRCTFQCFFSTFPQLKIAQMMLWNVSAQVITSIQNVYAFKMGTEICELYFQDTRSASHFLMLEILANPTHPLYQRISSNTSLQTTDFMKYCHYTECKSCNVNNSTWRIQI